jgi:hypothetical protein
VCSRSTGRTKKVKSNSNSNNNSNNNTHLLLYSGFAQLIQDDTPMVRRAAAKSLAVSALLYI